MWVIFESGGEHGRAVRASGERWVIGREADCDLVVPDDRVSRHHAMLRVYPDGRAELHEMHSANGTFVNGHRLSGPVLLSGGETIQVGETVLRTSLSEPSSSATTIGVTPPELRTDAPAATATHAEGAAMRRSLRTALIIAGVAVVGVVGLGALLISGAFTGDDGTTPATTTAATLDVPTIVRNARPSTVVVFARTSDGEGRGTGWVLDAAEGLVVTNQHVVNDGETFAVGVEGATRSATVVASAPCDDLAILKVSDTTGLKTMPLAASQAEVTEGDTVVALGFPGSASQTPVFTTTTGVVSVAKTHFDEQAADVPLYPNVVQTDAAINPGNSGGPLLDLKGNLVGVNSAGITLLGDRTIQGQGYAIGIDRVREVLPTLRSGRSMYWTGLGFDYVPDPTAEPNLPQQPGLYVDNVVAGSPAAQADFPTPSYVVAVNGRELDGTLQSYCSAVRGGPSDSATFSVLTSSDADATARDIRVAFASAPPG